MLHMLERLKSPEWPTDCPEGEEFPLNDDETTDDSEEGTFPNCVWRDKSIKKAVCKLESVDV